MDGIFQNTEYMDQSKTRDERKVFKKRISKIHFLSVSNMDTITNLRMRIEHFLASKDIKMYYREEFTTWRDV